MKKSDLKYGNVVETRNGARYLYHCAISDKLLHLESLGYVNLDNYNENLKFNNGNLNEFDIMKVYKDYTCKELLWERKEKPQLNEDEKAILRNIDKEYKWIARDDDGLLCVYKEKPSKDDYDGWNDSAFSFASLWAFDNLFQFIKWEDDEPYSIEELLKGK